MVDSDLLSENIETLITGEPERSIVLVPEYQKAYDYFTAADKIIFRRVIADSRQADSTNFKRYEQQIMNYCAALVKLCEGDTLETIILDLRHCLNLNVQHSPITPIPPFGGYLVIYDGFTFNNSIGRALQKLAMLTGNIDAPIVEHFISAHESITTIMNGLSQAYIAARGLYKSDSEKFARKPDSLLVKEKLRESELMQSESKGLVIRFKRYVLNSMTGIYRVA